MQIQQPLQEYKLIVHQQTWVSAWLQDNLLVVYRSVKLRDTDPLYVQATQLLAGWYEVLLKMTVTDENMMFGSAELEVYEIGVSDERTSFGIPA